MGWDGLGVGGRQTVSEAIRFEKRMKNYGVPSLQV